jgi:hypothetical protein
VSCFIIAARHKPRRVTFPNLSPDLSPCADRHDTTSSANTHYAPSSSTQEDLSNNTKDAPSAYTRYSPFSNIASTASNSAILHHQISSQSASVQASSNDRADNALLHQNEAFAPSIIIKQNIASSFVDGLKRDRRDRQGQKEAQKEGQIEGPFGPSSVQRQAASSSYEVQEQLVSTQESSDPVFGDLHNCTGEESRGLARDRDNDRIASDRRTNVNARCSKSPLGPRSSIIERRNIADREAWRIGSGRLNPTKGSTDADGFKTRHQTNGSNQEYFNEASTGRGHVENEADDAMPSLLRVGHKEKNDTAMATEHSQKCDLSSEAPKRLTL